MNKIKGNIPVYVMTGASIIVSLVTYIYMTTTSSQAENIKEAQTSISSLNNRATVLETNYANLQKGQDKISDKLDKLLNKI